MDTTGDDWLCLVEEPWGHVYGLHRMGRVDGFIPDEEKEEVFVKDRDLYIHVDAARVKNVPSEWTNSVSVIKFRLSGVKRGTNQLCGVPLALHTYVHTNGPLLPAGTPICTCPGLW